MTIAVSVIGRNGQLALALHEAALRYPGLSINFIGRADLDISKLGDIRTTLGPMNFDVMINAAAYTNVDMAETESTPAMTINRDAAGILAQVAAERGAPIIHISTDYVFSGEAGPYDEHAAPAPINMYGRSKLDGEHAVIAANARRYIFRTAWVHSNYGRNFVRTMLGAAADKPLLRVVGDQFGSPTNALRLADQLLGLISRGRDFSERYGTYHLAGSEVVSWFTFAEATFAHSRELGGRLPIWNA